MHERLHKMLLENRVVCLMHLLHGVMWCRTSCTRCVQPDPVLLCARLVWRPLPPHTLLNGIYFISATKWIHLLSMHPSVPLVSTHTSSSLHWASVYGPGLGWHINVIESTAVFHSPFGPPTGWGKLFINTSIVLMHAVVQTTPLRLAHMGYGIPAYTRGSCVVWDEGKGTKIKLFSANEFMFAYFIWHITQINSN